MPLTINCGLSRKASENYQSLGVSINVTAELDQSLLARPDDLQRQIDALYRQAQTALERQASGMGPPDSTPMQQDAGRSASHDSSGPHQHSNGNGNTPARGYRNGSNGNGRGNGRGSEPATDNQLRAIKAIAACIGTDPQYEAREIVGIDLEGLTIRQASSLIDHLNSIESAGNGRNGSNR